MLAAEVFLHEERIHGRVGVDAERDEGHLGDLLHDDGVIDGIVGILAPGEWSVVFHQHTGGVHRVDVAVDDPVDDDSARLLSYSAIWLSTMSPVQGISSWK